MRRSPIRIILCAIYLIVEQTSGRMETTLLIIIHLGLTLKAMMASPGSVGAQGAMAGGICLLHSRKSGGFFWEREIGKENTMPGVTRILTARCLHPLSVRPSIPRSICMALEYWSVLHMSLFTFFIDRRMIIYYLLSIEIWEFVLFVYILHFYLFIVYLIFCIFCFLQ